MNNIEITTLENGPFMVNSFLVTNKDTNNGIIIDPGANIQPLIIKITEENIKLEAIVGTHGHIDHIDGVNTVKNKFDVPFYLNEYDKDLADNIQVQAQMFGVSDPGKVIVDKNLPETGEIEFIGLKFQLLYTPGHSKGSVSLKLEDIVFCGDVLFNMSIGRTDLPGGDYDTLISSIKKNLFPLSDATRILSGHGPETSIGIEKKVNPFLT
jgi:hydroxyacylglutathione hydrolase